MTTDAGSSGTASMSSTRRFMPTRPSPIRDCADLPNVAVQDGRQPFGSDIFSVHPRDGSWPAPVPSSRRCTGSCCAPNGSHSTCSVSSASSACCGSRCGNSVASTSARTSTPRSSRGPSRPPVHDRRTAGRTRLHAGRGGVAPGHRDRGLAPPADRHLQPIAGTVVAGDNVVTALVQDDGVTVLVNRGFVPLGTALASPADRRLSRSSVPCDRPQARRTGELTDSGPRRSPRHGGSTSIRSRRNFPARSPPCTSTCCRPTRPSSPVTRLRSRRPSSRKART